MDQLLRYAPLFSLLMPVLIWWLYRIQDRDSRERRERQERMDKKFDALGNSIEKHIDEDRVNFREVHQRLDQHLALHSRGLALRGGTDG